MALIYNPDEPIEVQLGELGLDDVIYDGEGIVKIRDIPNWWPYYDRKFGDLHLYDIVVTYKYYDDEGIPYHRLDLEPFITNYLFEMDDFGVFVEIAEEMFSDFYSLAWMFDALADVNDVPEIFLPKLSALIKYRYKYDLPVDVNRDMIKRLFWLYEQKATDKDVLDHADFANNPDWFGSTLFYPDGYPDERTAALDYPVEHLFTHDVSKHSGIDRFQDSTRYRDGVIVIKLIQITDAIREAIRRVLPAGIKLYFDESSDFSGTEDGSVTELGGIINMWSWIRIYFEYAIHYYMHTVDRDSERDDIGFDMSGLDINHRFSGRQVLFFNNDIEFTDVASTLPLYIKGYYGNLTLNYMPDEPDYGTMPIGLIGTGLRGRFLGIVRRNLDVQSNISPVAEVDDGGLDLGPLREAIRNTIREAYSVIVSEDGTDVSPFDKWATPQDREALMDVVGRAKAFLEEPTDQRMLDSLVKRLRNAVKTFKDTFRDGLRGITSDKYGVDFKWDESQMDGRFLGDQLDPMPAYDTRELEKTVEKAYNAAYSGIISEDGTDVPPLKLWTSKSAQDALLGLVTQAREFLLEPNLQSEVDAWVERLEEGINTFLESFTYGSMLPIADKYDMNFIWDGSLYSGKYIGTQIEPPPTYDTSELETAIEEALELLESTYASTNGLNIDEDKQWTTYEERAAFREVVDESVRKVLDYESQDDIDSQLEKLTEASEHYISTLQYGLYHEVVHPPRNLGDYHLIDELKISREQKFTGNYRLNDPIMECDPKYVDFATTDIWRKDGPAAASIPGYEGNIPEDGVNRFSPYTENPIHDLDYEIYDTELVRKWKGMPTYDEQFTYSGKRRFSGDNNIIFHVYPIEDVLPQDDYYPVSAVEHLYVNEYQNDTRVNDNYDGVHTARNSYYKPISQFGDKDAVDIDGVAVLFRDLTEERIRELTVGDDLLKFTMSNDFYLKDYCEPMEVETVAGNP